MTSLRNPIMLGLLTQPLVLGACLSPENLAQENLADENLPAPPHSAEQLPNVDDESSSSARNNETLTSPTSRVLVLSDGDMQPTAYVTDVLGEPFSTGDRLTIFAADDDGVAEVDSLAVSNAVTSVPFVLDVSVDQRLAYVVETNSERGNATTLSGLPVGRLLSVVDLCSEDRARVVHELEIDEQPLAVRASPDGRYLAIPHRGGALSIADLEDPVAPRIIRFTLPAFASHVEWHPTANVIAVVLQELQQVRFYRVIDGGFFMKLRSLGNAVATDRRPFSVQFSPDGRFAYVNNIIVSDDVDLGPNPNPADFLGSLQVIRFDGKKGRHAAVQTLATPIFPEGIALSSDGSLIAIVSLQTSSLPPEVPLFAPFNALSIYRRDADSGELQLMTETQFSGILAEGVVFEPDSDRIAVAVYQDESASDVGAVDLWTIDRDAETVTLQQRMLAPGGAHEVRWLRGTACAPIE